MGYYKRVNLFVFNLLPRIVLVLLWETVCFSFLVLVVVAAVQTIIASSFSSLLNRDSNNLVCVCLSDKMGRNLWVFDSNYSNRALYILFFFTRGSVQNYKILLSSLDYGSCLILRCVFQYMTLKVKCVVMVVGSCGGKSGHYCLAVYDRH